MVSGSWSVVSEKIGGRSPLQEDPCWHVGLVWERMMCSISSRAITRSCGLRRYPQRSRASLRTRRSTCGPGFGHAA